MNTKTPALIPAFEVMDSIKKKINIYTVLRNFLPLTKTTNYYIQFSNHYYYLDENKNEYIYNIDTGEIEDYQFVIRFFYPYVFNTDEIEQNITHIIDKNELITFDLPDLKPVNNIDEIRKAIFELYPVNEKEKNNTDDFNKEALNFNKIANNQINLYKYQTLGTEYAIPLYGFKENKLILKNLYITDFKHHRFLNENGGIGIKYSTEDIEEPLKILFSYQALQNCFNNEPGTIGNFIFYPQRLPNNQLINIFSQIKTDNIKFYLKKSIQEYGILISILSFFISEESHIKFSVEEIKNNQIILRFDFFDISKKEIIMFENRFKSKIRQHLSLKIEDSDEKLIREEKKHLYKSAPNQYSKIFTHSVSYYNISLYTDYFESFIQTIFKEFPGISFKTAISIFNIDDLVYLIKPQKNKENNETNDFREEEEMQETEFSVAENNETNEANKTTEPGTNDDENFNEEVTF